MSLFTFAPSLYLSFKHMAGARVPRVPILPIAGARVPRVPHYY